MRPTARLPRPVPDAGLETLTDDGIPRARGTATRLGFERGVIERLLFGAAVVIDLHRAHGGPRPTKTAERRASRRTALAGALLLRLEQLLLPRRDRGRDLCAAIDNLLRIAGGERIASITPCPCPSAADGCIAIRTLFASFHADSSSFFACGSYRSSTMDLSASTRAEPPSRMPNSSARARNAASFCLTARSTTSVALSMSFVSSDIASRDTWVAALA